MLEYLYTPWRESFLNRCFLQNDNLTFFYLLHYLWCYMLSFLKIAAQHQLHRFNLGKHLKTWKLLNVENNLHLPSLILGSPVTLM